MQCFVNGNSSTVPSSSPVDTQQCIDHSFTFHEHDPPPIPYECASDVQSIAFFFFFFLRFRRQTNFDRSFLLDHLQLSRTRVIGINEFRLVEWDSTAIFATFYRRFTKFNHFSLRLYKKNLGVIIYCMALRVFPTFGYQ